ncbi:TIR domain-containing protein [Paractinoplanes lichenicola]|uniref:Nucleotide-binding protein n=1 Tax=Paractinoplanes lichenicola TaxID=2802976 RepID=A0ABS1VGU5_9ACTN|nr:nucleotide-binding protein [Actinoplanes lichenicola]MBL7253928.1 nucleotide-binding protein [Actinoplanes lichenicola]
MGLDNKDLIRLFLALKEQVKGAAGESGESAVDVSYGHQFNALAVAARERASIQIPAARVLEPPRVADLVSQINFATTVLGLDERAVEGKEEVSAKPRIFIGCSVEGLTYAKLIQLQLASATHTTIWNQGVFGLSKGTLETLVAQCRSYDYAVLVLTPDDMRVKREQPGQVPRDNVVFELGLFMGALGRERVFMVVQEGTELPTDMAGITPATFDATDSTNLVSALGPVTTMLEISMGLIR